MSVVQVSQMDIEHLSMIRRNVVDFMNHCARYVRPPGKLLDVAPQDHGGVGRFFDPVDISTLDIDPRSGASFIADLCKDNSALIPASHFDWVVCTEVLEHTLNPFHAVTEISRVLRPGGYLFASAPFNFRIHGPLPDCWRFSHLGWKSLMAHAHLDVLELSSIETNDRNLMPIHYTVVARKPC